MTDDQLIPLQQELCSTNPQRRAEAARQLSEMEHAAAPAAVPLLCTLRDHDEQVREWVTAALENLGAPSRSDLAHLAPMVQDENPDIGYWAATLLGRLEAAGLPALEVLVEALRHSPHSIVRERAAWALGKLGSGAGAALSDLKEAAKADEPRLARLARLAKHAVEQIHGVDE